MISRYFAKYANIFTIIEHFNHRYLMISRYFAKYTYISTIGEHFNHTYLRISRYFAKLYLHFYNLRTL